MGGAKTNRAVERAGPIQMELRDRRARKKQAGVAEAIQVDQEGQEGQQGKQGQQSQQGKQGTRNSWVDVERGHRGARMAINTNN